MDSMQSKTDLPARDVDSECAQMCATPADQQLREEDTRSRLVLGNKEAIEHSAEAVEILQTVAAAMRGGRVISVVPQICQGSPGRPLFGSLRMGRFRS